MNSLRIAVSSKASASALVAKNRIKRRKKDVTEISAQATGKPVRDLGHGRSAPDAQSWGPLELLRPTLGPILDLIKPMITANMVAGVMAFLLFMSWLRPRRDPFPARGPGVAYPGLITPERIAAYEEIWRREESGLWDWLDERVGVDRLASSGMSGKDMERKEQRQTGTTPRGQHLESRLGQERMNDRQIVEAIRVTQEKLDDLKRIMERRKKVRAEDAGERGGRP